MSLKNCGIYKITNLINGKVYIGQSIDIQKRWKYHLSDAFYKNAPDYNCIFHQAIRKYGKESFKFEVLEECSPEDLNSREKFYINYYKSFSNNHEFGYNMTPGGDREFNFSLEPKQPSHIPCPICGQPMWRDSKCCKKCSKNFYAISIHDERINGVKITPPAKEELLKSLYENRIDYLVASYYNISTMLLTKWKEELGIPRKREDYIKLYEEEYLGVINKNIKYKRSKVAQISLETNEILNIFDNCNQAAKHLGFEKNEENSTYKGADLIRECCLGKVKNAYNYFWKFYEEDKL